MSTPDLEAVYRRYFPLIRARCARILENDEEANDVAQETFIRLWKSGRVGEAPREAAAWAHRTAVHLSIDRLRQRARSAGPIAPQEEGPPFADELLDRRRHLQLLVKRVPADALEAGVLHRVDGLTQAEVALTMGCSERTVRRLLVTLEERLVRFRAEVLT